MSVNFGLPLLQLYRPSLYFAYEMVLFRLGVKDKAVRF